MASFTVERSAEVAAPAERVHALIDDFHQWTQWSPWEGLDPDLQRTYTGPDQGVGAHYEWSGNRKAGSGSMEITGSTPTGIDVALVFRKPFRSTNVVRFSITPLGEASTSVTWRMDGETSGVSGLVSRFMSFDKLVGPDFERGLSRLKAVAEEARS